jgi:hypothetical protein
MRLLGSLSGQLCEPISWTIQFGNLAIAVWCSTRILMKFVVGYRKPFAFSELNARLAAHVNS